MMFAVFVWVSLMVALDEPRAGKGTFIGLIVLAFLVGMAAAVLQMEILTKPMALCLPQHRRTVARFILTVGVAANAAGAMLFLLYPGLPFGWRLLVLGSAFAAGLVFYLAGAWWVFLGRQPMALVGFWIAVFFFGQQLGLHVRLERIVVLHPLAVMTVGVLTALAMWMYMTRADLARRNCLRPWVGFAEVFDRDKLRRSPQYRSAAPWTRLKDHPRPWVEKLFLGCMTRCRPVSVTRYLWGAMYTAFGLCLSRWTDVLLFVLFLAIALGYMGPRMWGVVAFVPLILVYNAKPPVFSSMLTGGGRNERFYSTVMVAVVSSVLLMLFVGGVIAASALLSSVVPEIQYHHHTLSYRVVTAKCLYAPLILLPIAGTLHLVLYRRPVLMLVASMMIVYAIVMSGFVIRMESVVTFGLQTSATIGVAAWIVFVLVLHHICARRCLTG